MLGRVCRGSTNFYLSFSFELKSQLKKMYFAYLIYPWLGDRPVLQQIASGNKQLFLGLVFGG
jgi:hypothetical protein